MIFDFYIEKAASIISSSELSCEDLNIIMNQIVKENLPAEKMMAHIVALQNLHFAFPRIREVTLHLFVSWIMDQKKDSPLFAKPEFKKLLLEVFKSAICSTPKENKIAVMTALSKSAKEWFVFRAGI